MPTSQEDHGPRIVVGVDGSPSSLEALRWAVRQARLVGSSVDAVIAREYPAGIGGFGWAHGRVIDTTDFGEVARKTLSDAVAMAVEPGSDVPVRQFVIEGHPAQVLINAADGADLLVVGSRGARRIHRRAAWLGKSALHAPRPCPVLVIGSHRDRSGSSR